jgi:hypothetical protein
MLKASIRFYRYFWISNTVYLSITLRSYPLSKSLSRLFVLGRLSLLNHVDILKDRLVNKYRSLRNALITFLILQAEGTL